MVNCRGYGDQVLRVSTLASALAFAMAAGCGGGGGGGGGSDDPPPAPPDPPPASFGPNFSEIQDAVFTPTCAVSGCHLGSGAQQGLQLDEANSYANLVDVPSTEVPSVLRVAPGDPDNSYLIRKLEGTASVGEQMPLNQEPLPQADIDVIRQWISDGAIDDRASSGSAIRVLSLSPAPGSQLQAAPPRIVAVFDREPDVSTVNFNTFILEASGGDGTFSDGNEVRIDAAAITVSPRNAKSARFELTDAALPDDTYRVRLLGSGPSMVLDWDANALDGEFFGTIPAGNGIQGGDFEAEFIVATPPGSDAR